MPEWINTALTIFAAILGFLGIKELSTRIWKRKFPTDDEKADVNKKNAEWNKLYADAAFVKSQLFDEMKKMVEEETEKLRDIIVQREIEHRQTVEDYIKRISDKDRQLIKFQQHLSEAEKEIAKLKFRVSELEAVNGKG